MHADIYNQSVVDRIFELVGTKRGAKQELAKYLGITPMRISDWKAGRLASYRKYTAQIAEYFGVTEEWLLGDTIPDTKKKVKEPLNPVTLDRILQLVGTQYGAQRELCRALGIDKYAVLNWRGKRNSSYSYHLPEIAEFYGVTLDWLLGVTDSLEGEGAIRVACSDPEIIEVVRARIFIILEEKQLTRSGLCRHLGKTACTFNSWRLGSTSYIGCLPEIAEYLGVDLEWLVRPLGAWESIELPKTEHVFKDKTVERILSIIPKERGKHGELARALGVSAATMSTWTSEKTKGYLKHLPEIADYYGVSLAWLSGCSETKDCLK